MRHMLGAIITLGPAVLLPAALFAQSPRVQVNATPSLTIAATTEAGELRFATAAWATRLPSGEIAVADVGESSIRIIGTNGELARTLGRRGAGPGEYRLPIWVGTCGGNALTVWDASARVSRYSAAASATETPVTRTIGEGAQSLTAACATDGHLALLQGLAPRRDIPPVLTGESPFGGPYQVVEMSAGLVRVDSAGSARTVRESISHGQWAMGQISPQGGMGALPRPLSASTSFTFSGDILVIADGATGSVTGVAADGREAFRFSAAIAARKPGADDYARAATSAVAMVPAQLRENAVKLVNAIPQPEALPQFWRVLADPDGLIWLVTSPQGAAQTQFRVYSRSGQLLAEPRVNGAFEPFEVGAAHLLGKRENADGEDEVVLLWVTRAR